MLKILLKMFKKIKKILNNKKYELVKTGSYSIKGRKNNQEDAFLIDKKGKSQLVLVADGVGGHAHGEFASNKTIEIFKNIFAQSDNFGNIPDFFRKTTLVAASMVVQKSYEDPKYKLCGTTLTGFFIKEGKYYTINVGDSRVYLFSDGNLKRLTKDHSIVQKLLDEKKITEQEALTHPKRTIMTSAIGQSLSSLKIDISEIMTLKKNDILFAFSDGVHDALKDDEIKNIIEKNINKNELAEIIVNEAYKAGGKDNITACFYKCTTTF